MKKLIILFLLSSMTFAKAQTPSLTTLPAPTFLATGQLSLSAVFAGTQKPVQNGLVWRIFEELPDGATITPLAQSSLPNPTLPIKTGSYIIHVSYGLASAMKHITLREGNNTERLILNAGALKLGGVIGETRIPQQKLTFSIFVPEGSYSEGRLILENTRGSELIRLPEGQYHVVSNYGDSNAISRADVKVDNGKATEAILTHRAATLTLKLVASAGGEAFAGTAFSVLTPGGDVIREAIGAFPMLTLAEGEYTLIARHDGKIYTRDFRVESGLDRDIEVLAQ